MTTVRSCALRPLPLFVPLEALPSVDSEWIAPPARAYRSSPPTPLHQLFLRDRFPDQIEVGLDGIGAILDRLLSLDGAPTRDELLRRIRYNHLGIDLDRVRPGTLLDLRLPIERAPTRSELIKSPIVSRAVEDAWRDSEASDPMRRHEEGGWIYLNVVTGVVFTDRAPNGASSTIDLSNPILYQNAVIVGTFHTHPHPADENFVLGPSLSDEQMDESRGVPGIVRSWAGYHAYGCEQRERLWGSGFYPGTPEHPLDGAAPA